MKRNIIVIGASSGGFDALQRLVAGLPPDIDAAIFIVWHLSPDSDNVLPHILGRQSRIPAAPAVDGETIIFPHIYTAPPDRHLILEGNRMRVSRGPRENRFRPAVDPLFRSAAIAYGPRVIGIILSGALDDGSAGLWSIKQQGGIAIVQDPSDAEVASMPRNAMRSVKVDYIVPAEAMGELLGRLAAGEAPEKKEVAMEEEERSRDEIRIAIQDDLRTNIKNFGTWTPFTCPECHGALSALMEGGRVRYRCHTGHAFSVDSLLDALSESIEDSLWNAIRSIKENVLLLNHIGDHFAEGNEPRMAALFFKKALEAEARMDLVWHAAKGSEHLNTDSVRQQGREDENLA